jgi:type IV secretion system protein VirD4
MVMAFRHAPEWGAYVWGIGAAICLAGAAGVVRDIAETLTKAARTFRALRPPISDQNAAWLTAREARKAGLTGSKGLFLGILEGRPIFVRSFVHCCVIAPSRSGKTTSFTVPAALHDPGFSRVFTDFNGDITKQCAPAIRDQGHELICLDPAHLGGEGTGALNPLDVIVDRLENAPQDAIADGRSLAETLHPGPTGPQDPFWANGAQEILSFGIVAVCALRAREDANLSDLYSLLSDDEALSDLLGEARKSELLGGELADQAKRITSTWTNTPKILESFRVGALQSLSTFGPSSRIAPIIAESTFNPADLKKKKITLNIVCDASRMDQYRDWIKVTLWAIQTWLVREGNAKPVWFILDEFTNYPLANLMKALTGLASAGIHMALIFQEPREVARVYGEDALKTILSQTTVKLFFSASGEMARLISEYLGEEELVSENFSLGRTLDDAPGLSFARARRALLAAARIRELPEDETLAIIGNNKPMRLVRAGFQEVEPWRSLVKPLARFGERRFMGTLKMVIRNGRARATRAGTRRIKRVRRPLIRPLIAAGWHFLPGMPALLLVAGTLLIATVGWPHLRIEYTRSFSWCSYSGLPVVSRSFVIHGQDHCPLILWRKTGGRG